jgi:RNA polymerase sigma-70 factor (ECF subfamily)
LETDGDDLLAPCRAGDLGAWRALYQRYLPLVYRVARRMGVPEPDFPDLCQEVFLRVFRGLPRFRGDALFATWLYRIVLHEVARSGRARAVRTALLALLGQMRVAPADLAARVDASVELQRLLTHLKPKQRRVFVLFELEQLPIEQIAAIVGCPVETARSRLRLARAAFSRLRRQQLLERGSR